MKRRRCLLLIFLILRLGKGLVKTINTGRQKNKGKRREGRKKIVNVPLLAYEKEPQPRLPRPAAFRLDQFIYAWKIRSFIFVFNTTNSDRIGTDFDWKTK